MVKRLTTEYVRGRFEARGWFIPLGWVYVNSKTLIPYTCENGHSHQITWGGFQQGYGCLYCSGKAKHTTEFVRSEFNKAKKTIPDDWVYKNNEALIPYTCENGHSHQISWIRFQLGNECPYCLEVDRLNNETKFIRSYFLSFNYQIAPNWVYENARALIPYICPQGHHHKISWGNFQRGQRCGVCSVSNQYLIKGLNSSFSNIKISIKISQKFYIDLWQHPDYSDQNIHLISDPIQSIYDNCPQGYHVDHIIPKSWFDLTDPIQLKACWSINNLRHLSAIINMKRHNMRGTKQIKYLREIAKNEDWYKIFLTASQVPGRQQTNMKTLRKILEDKRNISA